MGTKIPNDVVRYIETPVKKLSQSISGCNIVTETIGCDGHACEDCIFDNSDKLTGEALAKYKAVTRLALKAMLKEFGDE